MMLLNERDLREFREEEARLVTRVAVLEHHIKEAIELIEQALTERWDDQPATLRAALDTLHLGADER